MAATLYALENGDVTASPRRTLVVTPSDSVELPHLSRAIRANGAGVINVVNADGTTCLANFLAGETRIMCVRYIMATSTTATGIEVSF